MGSLSPVPAMYTVARRPAEVVQKTRRGFNKNIDNVNNPGPDTLAADSPDATKIVFRPVKMRNMGYPRSPSLESPEERLSLSPEYLEIVNFVNNGWSCVKLELEQDNSSVKYYQEKSNPALANFSPFDLDAWWGKGSTRTSPTGCDTLPIPPAEKTGSCVV